MKNVKTLLEKFPRVFYFEKNTKKFGSYIYIIYICVNKESKEKEMVNNVVLIGRLGQDPTTTFGKNGIQKTACTIATRSSYKPSDGSTVPPDWHNLVFWGKSAEILTKLAVGKGTLISINGELKTSIWEDKETGQKKSFTAVNIGFSGSFTILSPKSSPFQSQPSSDEYDDDLPF